MASIGYPLRPMAKKQRQASAAGLLSPAKSPDRTPWRLLGPLLGWAGWALGAAMNLSGARSQAAVKLLLALTAIWIFVAIITLEGVQKLSRLKKALLWSALLAVLGGTWWYASYRFFVPPVERSVERIPTPTEIADAVAKRLPPPAPPPKPKESPAPRPAPERVMTPLVPPALYSVRIQVFDPQDHPVEGATVRASVGNEPQRLPDGWWEVEIPAAKVPADGRISLWAEHEAWEDGRVDLQLRRDPNPSVEIYLKQPETLIRGRVTDSSGHALPGARVFPQDGTPGVATTDADGRFELKLPMPKDTRIRLRAEHPGKVPGDVFWFAGRDGCSIVLEGT
jgi:hypothetical protein